jgi:hypothetical protein
MGLEEIYREAMKLAQDCVQWHALVLMQLNLQDLLSDSLVFVGKYLM